MKLASRFLIRLFALLVWRGIDLLVAEAGPRQLVLGQGGISGEITNASAPLEAPFTQAIETNTSVTPQGGFRQIISGDELVFERSDWHGLRLLEIDIGAAKVVVSHRNSSVINTKFHEAWKAKTLTPGQKAFLESQEKTLHNTLATGIWHELLVKITGSTVNVAIEGTPVASVTSEGVSHPSKRMLRLSALRGV